MRIVIYTLATFGALMVLWCLIGALLLPAGGENACVLVRMAKRPGRTERQLRALSWLQDTGLVRLQIVLLRDGLAPEQQDLAEHWLRRFPGMALADFDSLPDRMREE